MDTLQNDLAIIDDLETYASDVQNELHHYNTTLASEHASRVDAEVRAEMLRRKLGDMMSTFDMMKSLAKRYYYYY